MLEEGGGWGDPIKPGWPIPATESKHQGWKVRQMTLGGRSSDQGCEVMKLTLGGGEAIDLRWR